MKRNLPSKKVIEAYILNKPIDGYTCLGENHYIAFKVVNTELFNHYLNFKRIEVYKPINYNGYIGYYLVCIKGKDIYVKTKDDYITFL